MTLKDIGEDQHLKENYREQLSFVPPSTDSPSLKHTAFALGETFCVNQHAWEELNTPQPRLKQVNKAQSNQCFPVPRNGDWLRSINQNK